MVQRKENPFDRSAALLLEGKDTLSEEQAITVMFSERGMTIPADHHTTGVVPYSDFECVVETADLFLLVYGKRITVLHKQDLRTGYLRDLILLLSEKVADDQSSGAVSCCL